MGRIQRSRRRGGPGGCARLLRRRGRRAGLLPPRGGSSDAIEITEGRHPVVEKMLKHALFVPNDTHMDNRDDTVAIITGPNMAGKSTYMRQVASLCSWPRWAFVPARSAHIGIVDRVFTRIGASDDLSAGQSTFMVEMTEVAELLKKRHRQEPADPGRSAGAPPPTTACPSHGRCWSSARTRSAWGPRPSSPPTTTS